MSQARVLTRPLGGSSLANLAARGEASEFFPARPRDVAGWRARVEEVRDASPTDWWSALSPAIGTESHAAKIGPLEVSVQEKETVTGPDWMGAAAIVAGALLLVVGRK